MAYQGFNVNCLTPAGKMVNFKEVSVEFPDLWELKNGVQIYKDGDANGKVVTRGRVLFYLTGLAAGGGSWQQIQAVPFLNLDIPDDTGGLPLEVTLENVVFHLPKSFAFNRLEGSDDWFEIPFGVKGQAYVNLLPVFAHRNDAGL